MGVPRLAHPPADPHPHQVKKNKKLKKNNKNCKKNPHQRQGAEAEEQAVRDGRVLTKALLCLPHVQPIGLVRRYRLKKKTWQEKTYHTFNQSGW